MEAAFKLIMKDGARSVAIVTEVPDNSVAAIEAVRAYLLRQAGVEKAILLQVGETHRYTLNEVKSERDIFGWAKDFMRRVARMS